VLICIPCLEVRLAQPDTVLGLHDPGQPWERLLTLADKQPPGRRVWALEGTGCHGAGLTRFLVDEGEWVVEIDRPKWPRGRHGAKSDVLDAIRAGREALARDHLTTPRQRGHREALRVLHSWCGELPPVWAVTISYR
jgi:hypothetical protein